MYINLTQNIINHIKYFNRSIYFSLKYHIPLNKDILGGIKFYQISKLSHHLQSAYSFIVKVMNVLI